MTAAMATWADCWAVTGLWEDLIGRQALFRDHVTHYTQNLLAGAPYRKVNRIKQVIKQGRSDEWLCDQSVPTVVVGGEQTNRVQQKIYQYYTVIDLSYYTQSY